MRTKKCMVIFAVGCLTTLAACSSLKEEPAVQVSRYYSNITQEEKSLVVTRGVEALRDRTPGELIRGSLDPKYGLNDFGYAATSLARDRNAKAEYILGWLCENGDQPEIWPFPDYAKTVDKSELKPMGFAPNKVIAGQWYNLASEDGCSDASVQLALLLQQAPPSPHREQCLALADKYLQKGMSQGNSTACIDMALSYAYGSGVQADAQKAWNLFQQMIYSPDKSVSERAIVNAIQAWKNDKINPPQSFSHGFSDAYTFVRSFDVTMTKANLDDLYQYHGFTPDPYPQLRLALADKIRRRLSK